MSAETLFRGTAIKHGTPQRRLGTSTEIQITIFGTGAISAKGTLWGTNDKKGWINLGTLEVSGTPDPANDFYPSDSNGLVRQFKAIKFQLTEKSGSLTDVWVTQSGNGGGV